MSSAKHARAWLCGISIAALAASVLSSGPSVAASSDYLKRIQEEAKRGGARVDQESAVRANAPALADEAKSRVTQGQFEEALRRDYPASYSLYEKLNPQQKADVYGEYQSTGQYDRATARILKLLYNI